MLATTCPSSMRSRRRTPPSRRSSRWQNTRPAKRSARAKTASRVFLRQAPKTRPVSVTQTAGTHQATWVWAYDFASGCAVAPNTTGGDSTLLGGVSSGVAGSGMPVIPKPLATGSIASTSAASTYFRNSPLANTPTRIPTPIPTNPAAVAPNAGVAVGRLLPYAGVAGMVIDVAYDRNPLRAATGNWFGFLGSMAGGAVGGLPGAIAGGYAGYNGGLAVYDVDAARAESRRNQPFRRDPGGGL